MSRAKARDHLAIADREADPPSGHVVAFRKREELDRDVARARHFHDRGRLIAVETEVGVGEIVHHQNLILAGEIDHPLHEAQVDDRGGRIVREVHDHELRARPAAADRRHQLIEEFVAVAQRHALDLGARNDASVLMNRIGRRRREHHVALIENRQSQMRDAFLGADRGDGFRIGIEFDVVAPLVPVANRQPQLVDAARDRIAMVGGLGGGLDQLV